MTKKTANAALHDEDADDAMPSTLPAHLKPNVAPAPRQRETAEEAAARIRAERQSGVRPRALDGTTRKLEVFGQIPGYRLAILNDYNNRLYQAELHGWVFVDNDEIQGVNQNTASYNTDPGNRVRFVVGTQENGEPLYGYLMKLPEEIWQDDQAAQAARDAYVDQQIRGGHAPGETKDDTEQRYNVRTTVDSIAGTRIPSQP